MVYRTINIIYVFMLFCSFIFVVINFFIWNPIYSVGFSLPAKSITHFMVEQCFFNKKSIYIKGWAYIPSEKHSNTFIYATTIDGNYVPIQKTSQFRGDFQNLGDPFPFNTFGFVASKKIIGKDYFTKNIVIIIKSEHGERYLAQYTCS